MSRVRRLIAVFALVLAAVPLQATATVLNGMKVIWQVDTARTILDNAVAGCPSISNVSLREQCRAYTEDLRSSIELWESNFSAGTLTVAFDANTEVTIYSDEVALKNIASEAGYTVTAAAINAVRSPLALAPDELAPKPDDAAGCDACFEEAADLTETCLQYAAGFWKVACVAAGVVLVFECGTSQECNEPPEPPKACT